MPGIVPGTVTERGTIDKKEYKMFIRDITCPLCLEPTPNTDIVTKTNNEILRIYYKFQGFYKDKIQRKRIMPVGTDSKVSQLFSESKIFGDNKIPNFMQNTYRGIPDTVLQKMMTDSKWLESKMAVCRNCTNKKETVNGKDPIATLEENFEYFIAKKILKNHRREQEKSTHNLKMRKLATKDSKCFSTSNLFQTEVPLRKNTADDNKIKAILNNNPSNNSYRLDTSKLSQTDQKSISAFKMDSYFYKNKYNDVISKDSKESSRDKRSKADESQKKATSCFKNYFFLNTSKTNSSLDKNESINQNFRKYTKNTMFTNNSQDSKDFSTKVDLQKNEPSSLRNSSTYLQNMRSQRRKYKTMAEGSSYDTDRGRPKSNNYISVYNIDTAPNFPKTKLKIQHGSAEKQKPSNNYLNKLNDDYTAKKIKSILTNSRKRLQSDIVQYQDCAKNMEKPEKTYNQLILIKKIKQNTK